MAMMSFGVWVNAAMARLVVTSIISFNAGTTIMVAWGGASARAATVLAQISRWRLVAIVSCDLCDESMVSPIDGEPRLQILAVLVTQRGLSDSRQKIDAQIGGANGIRFVYDELPAQLVPLCRA